jgi:homoserine kinase
MALDMWNSVHVELGAASLEIRGEGSEELPTDSDNLVKSSFALPFLEIGLRAPQVRIICENTIPVGKGLGSSSASIIGGLLAGNEMSGGHMSREDVLALAVRTEGHADNVAATLLGGFQIVVPESEPLITFPVPIPEGLTAVVFVPDVTMATKDARSLLSADVGRQDAVHNVSRVALLVGSFACGDLTHLAAATQDRLHQPARQAVFPAMKNIFRAALGAGALGVFLSGAGSGVLAITRGREMTIGYEMAEAASKSGVGGEFRVTRPTQKGAQVIGD